MAHFISLIGNAFLLDRKDDELDTGRLLIILGGTLIVVGFAIIFSSKIPWLGRLPGDIVIRKENYTFYFPLMTSIIASIVFSLILMFLNRR
ncbi:MAG: DUF2905 domain-containing protein [Candidatus Omnitrophota bacterium]